MQTEADIDALAERIRSEANIADRPGQYDRLNAVADEVSALWSEAAWEACWNTVVYAAWPDGGATRSFVLDLLLAARSRVIPPGQDQP